MMWNLIEVAFPGLGIDPFTVNKVAFSVFGLEVRWYGVMITLGMLCAFAYAMFRSKREGFTQDDVLDVGIYMVLFGVIGARLYYVFMKPSLYFGGGRSLWDTLGEIVNLRNGGLAIYGGIIGGIGALIVWCLIKKKSWLRLMDMAGPGVMIAQALGRWGNFFNGEAHGGIVAEGHPLYFLRMGLYPNDLNTPAMAYVHPTFLYESLWNVLGFVLINAFLYRRKKFNGEVAFAYLGWYGFGRMLIEGLRTDSLYLGGGDAGIRVSQLVGLLCFLGFAALIVYGHMRVRKQKAAGEYVPVFTAVTAQDADADQTDKTQNEDNDSSIKEDESNGKAD